MDVGNELLQVTLSAVKSLKGPTQAYTNQAEESPLFTPLTTPSQTPTPSGTISDSSLMQSNNSSSTPTTGSSNDSLNSANNSETSLPFTPSQSLIRVRVPSSMLKEVPSPFAEHQTQTPTPPPALRAHYTAAKPQVSLEFESSSKMPQQAGTKLRGSKYSVLIEEDHSSTNGSIVVVEPSTLQKNQFKQERARKALSTFKPHVPAGKVVYPVMVQHDDPTCDRSNVHGRNSDESVRNLTAVITSSATAAAVAASKQWLNEVNMANANTCAKQVQTDTSKGNGNLSKSVGPRHDAPCKAHGRLTEDIAKEIRGLKKDLAAEVEQDRNQILKKLEEIQSMRGSSPDKKPPQMTPDSPYGSESKIILPKKGGEEPTRCVVDRVTQTLPETKLNPSDVENQQSIIRSKLKDSIQSPLKTGLDQLCARFDQVQLAKQQIDMNLLWMQRDSERATFHRILQDSNLSSIHTKLDSLDQYATSMECNSAGQAAKTGSTCSPKAQKLQQKKRAAMVGASSSEVFMSGEKCTEGDTVRKKKRAQRQKKATKKSQPAKLHDEVQKIHHAVEHHPFPGDSLSYHPLHSGSPVHVALSLYPPRIMPSSGAAFSPLQPPRESDAHSVCNPPPEHRHVLSMSNTNLVCVRSEAGGDVEKRSCQVQVLPSVDIDSQSPSSPTQTATTSSATTQDSQDDLQSHPRSQEVDHSEYAEFSTVLDVGETSTEDSAVSPNLNHQPISIKGEQEVLVCEGKRETSRTTQTCEYHYDQCGKSVDRESDFAEKNLKKRLISGIAERVHEEILARVLAEQKTLPVPVDVVSCSTCTDRGTDHIKCEVLREDDPQYTEDGCQPDGEVLRTLVQDSVLVVVRDALLRHQKTVATTSGGDPDHRVDYSDDFECSASQVSLQSSPSTPLSTPPDSPRTSETEAHGKQNLDEVVPPAVTPLLTPLESSDEFTADVNVSQDERRNCVVEERDGGEGDETVVVEVVSTPQPTTDEDEDTLRSQESNDTLSDGVGRSEIAHPVVPTPNTTQLSSVEGPPSFTVSDHPCEETAEKRDVTLSETATSTTVVSQEQEPSSSESTTTFDQHLSFGEYLVDPVSKDKVVYDSGSVLSEGEVPHLIRRKPQFKADSRRLPPGGLSSDSDSPSTVQISSMSTSDDSASKVDDFSIGEVKKPRSPSSNLRKHLQKSLNISSPSDSSTPCQGSHSSSDDSTSSSSIGMVNLKQKQPRSGYVDRGRVQNVWKRNQPSTSNGILRDISIGEIPKGGHCDISQQSEGEVPGQLRVPKEVQHDISHRSEGEVPGQLQVPKEVQHEISHRSEGEIPRKLRLLLDPPDSVQPSNNGSLGEIVPSAKGAHSSKPLLRDGVDVIVVRSAKERIQQKYQTSLSLGEAVQSSTSETLGSLDTTAELRDVSSTSPNLTSKPPLIHAHSNPPLVLPQVRSHRLPADSEEVPYIADTFTVASSSPFTLSQDEAKNMTENKISSSTQSTSQQLSNSTVDSALRTSQHSTVGLVQGHHPPPNPLQASAASTGVNPHKPTPTLSPTQSVASSTVNSEEEHARTLSGFEPDSLKAATSSSLGSQATLSLPSF